jgi:hypothetical protein
MDFYLLLNFADADIIRSYIIPKLNIQNVYALCAINKQLRDICDDDNIWNKLIVRDFSLLQCTGRNINDSSKIKYILLYNRTKKVRLITNNIYNDIIKNNYPEDWGVGAILIEITSISIFDEINNQKIIHKAYQKAQELNKIYHLEHDYNPPQIMLRITDTIHCVILEVYNEINTETSEYKFLPLVDVFKQLIFNLVWSNIRLYNCRCEDVYERYQ